MTCKGVIFRYGRNRKFQVKTEYNKRYHRNDDQVQLYEYTRTYLSNYDNLYLKRRLSCKGCPECQEVYQKLWANELNNIKFDNMIHGKLYAAFIDRHGNLSMAELFAKEVE